MQGWGKKDINITALLKQFDVCFLVRMKLEPNFRKAIISIDNNIYCYDYANI